MERRNFLRAVGAIATFTTDAVERASAAAKVVEGRESHEIARDEKFWREIQSAFTLDRNMINLNNGGVCPSPRVVHEAVKRYQDISNIAPVYTMWNWLEPEVEGVRRRLAADFGCDPEELAITRNASEALEIAQLGIDMKAGDEVITTYHDYGRMTTTWQQRVRREGIVLKEVEFDVPAKSMDDLVKVFENAITPKTKVIHFSHITNITGQIFPVKRICQMARSRGILTIVDGAHAYAQFQFKQADLDCDYYGTSLHKWMLAPVGTGFLYMRKDRIAKTWPLMAAGEGQTNNIRKFEEIGTHPAAGHLAISEALNFHRGIGGENKAARLRYLRELWSERLGRLEGVTLYTPSDPQMSACLATFGVKGKTPGELSEKLWNNHRIIVTGIGNKNAVGLRITPNIYTTVDELDIFCTAVEKIVKA